MTLANLYLDLGFCETYPSTLLHCAINFPLSTDIAMISQQIIACPIGKRVVVLAGRITSNEECHILICDDDFPIDHHAPEPFLFERADLPAENYLLPPTSICQPHMKTRMNKGLWFWGQTLSASSEERLVFGYLKYLLLEALPLGEPLWGVMEDCLTSPIEITWPPVTGAESYTLQRLDFVGDNDVLQWVTIYEGEDASFSVAAEGGIKSYRFKAENGDESTGWSEIRRIKVKPTFELTIALDESETICSVYWGAVAGVKYFEVYRDDVLIKTTNYLGIADPLVAGQTYNYRVRAYVVGLSNDCYSEATGSLEVVETCLQPVITDFHIGDFFGGGTGGMAYWTTENATSHEFYINNVASDIYYGTSTEWYGGEKGTTAIFKLIAKCGNLQAESSISHYFEPCPGSDRPIISVFNVTQAYDTGAVTFLWEATEIGRADIYNNDILVATSTDMIFIELTANGTLRGGTITIPQPATLGQQTFTLKAINYDAPSCIGEATQSISLDEGYIPFIVGDRPFTGEGAWQVPHGDAFANNAWVKGLQIQWPTTLTIVPAEAGGLGNEEGDYTKQISPNPLDVTIQVNGQYLLMTDFGVDTIFIPNAGANVPAVSQSFFAAWGTKNEFLTMRWTYATWIPLGTHALNGYVTKGDLWLTLKEGSGLTMTVPGPITTARGDALGIHRLATTDVIEDIFYRRNANLASATLNPSYGKYISFQINCPRNAANTGWMKPSMLRCRAFDSNIFNIGAPLSEFPLYQCKYLPVFEGETVVVGGYILDSDFAAFIEPYNATVRLVSVGFSN